MTRLEHAERLGRDCADVAVDDGGCFSTDCEDRSLAPLEPLEGDYLCFKDLLGDDYTLDEHDEFVGGYQERLVERARDGIMGAINGARAAADEDPLTPDRLSRQHADELGAEAIEHGDDVLAAMCQVWLDLA
ncbi:MAG: hypothetical protein R6U98_06675 [Pirellulaceae bacterium]